MGILTGTVLYPVISVTKRHRLITWMFRLAAIPLAVLLYVVLIRNFYTSDPYAGQYVSYGLVNQAKTRLLYKPARDADTYLVYRPLITTIARGTFFHFLKTRISIFTNVLGPVCHGTY